MPTSLLMDVLTVLTILRTSDLRPREDRFLSPKGLTYINARLIISDELHSAPHRKQGGKRGSTELETHRIRFIHFLCEAADLIALTGKYLKPTPRVERWLSASAYERTAQLFEPAFLSSARRNETLRHAYHLFASEISLSTILASCAQLPLNQPFQIAAFTKLFPSENPNTIHELLNYLEWFGALTLTQTHFQLTDLSAILLRHPNAPAPETDPEPSPISIAPTLEITAPLNADLNVLYELADYTELESVKPQRVYRLDRKRIQHALERGMDLAHIFKFLESASQDALPQSVTETLQGWAINFNQITLQRVTLLQVRDPKLLSELSRAKIFRACHKKIPQELNPYGNFLLGETA